MTLTFTNDELELIAEALDSHLYWQIAPEDRRNSGYVMEPMTDEEREIESLEDRIRNHLRADMTAPFVCWTVGLGEGDNAEAHDVYVHNTHTSRQFMDRLLERAGAGAYSTEMQEIPRTPTRPD